MARFFKHESTRLAEQAAHAYGTRLAKADEANPAVVDAIAKQLDFRGWAVVIDATEDEISKVMQDQAARVLTQLQVEDADVLGLVNEDVQAFARERAAELVGMKVLPSGELVPNPNPAWAITETTREGIKGSITKGLEEGWTRDQLKKDIQDSYIFDESRARMIAQTEMSFANANANLTSWKASGVVEGRQWILADDHEVPDDCNENADAGVIPIDEEFPSGVFCEPAHPNCLCATVAVLMPRYASVLAGEDVE